VSSNLISIRKDVVAQLAEQCLILTSSVNFSEPVASKRVFKRYQEKMNEQGEADQAYCFILLCDSRSTASWDEEKFEVGSSKFEIHSRDFLMIVVRMAMSSLASLVIGSNRSFGTTSETDNSRSQ